jgi:hypothetical protein
VKIRLFESPISRGCGQFGRAICCADNCIKQPLIEAHSSRRCKLLRDHVPPSRRGLSAFAPSFAKKEREEIGGRANYKRPALGSTLQTVWPQVNERTRPADARPSPPHPPPILAAANCELTWKWAIHPAVYNCGRSSLSLGARAPCAAGTKINARRRSDQFRITALSADLAHSLFLSRSLFFTTFALYLRADFRQLVRGAHICFSRSHFEPLSPFD